MLKVVKFGASWCMPCKQLDKILNELKGDIIGDVKFESYDVESDVDYASKFEIYSLPTTFILDAENDDKILESFVGIKSSSQIRQLINKYK